MCGIAGHWSVHSLLSENQLRPKVRAMCHAVKHRGPDGHGLHVDTKSSLVLGHQRLSVLDLETGQQPISNQLQNLWLVFNGEIYNYRELRESLQSKGYIFTTQSDSEIIIYAYQEWGDNCVNHFQGMFAFAIWDKAQQKLFCARDRLGIKPFYYYWDHIDFIFCSELKGVVANDSVDKQLDYSVLSDYLHSNYSPGPQTSFKKVHKLQAGHILTIKGGECRIKQYWAISQDKSDHKQLSFDDASVELRHKLSQAVDARLVSDVPIGAFLSGGVDSSAIVALMSKSMNQPVLTHCVGFNAQNIDERKYAQQVSELIESNHRDSLVEIDVGSKLDEIIWHMDEPFADASAIPTYYLCEEARKRVTVCLSGDGGDELFSGYNWYAELARLSQIDQAIPKGIRTHLLGPLFKNMPYHLRGATFLKNIGVSAKQRHINLMSCFDRAHMERLLADDIKYEISQSSHPLNNKYDDAAGNWDAIKQAQLADMQTYLVEDILMKVDKMSMAHSLEVRVPMLDHRVVEFAFQQPTKFKVRGENRKRLLKHAMSDLIPESVVNRKKQGFTVPLRGWLLNDLKERVGDLLLSSTRSKSGVFKTSEVEKLWKQFQHQGLRIDLSQHMWSLLCYEMWHQQYA